MWKIESYSDTVQKMRVELQRNHSWEFKILLTSDRHLDNKHSNLKLQKKHLVEAIKHNWPVIDTGDIMCAMQGRKDFRSSRIALRNCLNDKEEYFDSVVDFAFDFLEPFKKQFALMGLGNHETSIVKHNETNLTKRLVKRLQESGSPTVMGAYSGWLKVFFNAKTGQGKAINIRYTHGAGGAAPVTKGVIKTNRRAVNFPDANIIISGHTHEAFCVPIARERVTDQGIVYIDEQLHVQIPSYKDETTGHAAGFAVEREFAPKPTGAYWLKFWYERDGDTVHYDAERAR